MAIVRDKMTRRARKNGACASSLSFIFVRPAVLSALPPCPAFSANEIERERKLGERGWNDGDGVEGKKRTYRGTARQRGTVRSDASRRREESRQPRSQTVKLCAKREGRVRTIGSFVRLPRPIFCHSFPQRSLR